MGNSCISEKGERLNTKIKNQEHDAGFLNITGTIVADYIARNQAVRKLHIHVAIKLKERAGELASAPRQYTSAYCLPLFSQKKTQTSVQTCSILTRSCPE